MDREGIEPFVTTSLFFDNGVTNRREEHDPKTTAMATGFEPALTDRQSVVLNR